MILQKTDRQDIISRIITAFFILLLFMILSIKINYIFEIVPVLIAVLGSLVLIFALLFLYKFYDAIMNKICSALAFVKRISYIKMLIILVFVSLFTKLVCIFVFRIDSINSHPDINVYITTSKELARNGFASKYGGYCYSYSHMFWFSVFLLPITKVFGDSQIAFSIYLSVINTISVFLFFDVVTKVFSKDRAFVILIAFVLLPSQILLPQYITHENALLFFLSITVWLYFKVIPSIQNSFIKKCIYVLFILNLFFCYMVNGLGLVIFLAFFILFIIELLRKKTKRYLLVTSVKCISIIGILILGSIITNYIQLSHTQLEQNYVRGNKVLWTLYVGSNSNTKGAWSIEDCNNWDNLPEETDELAIDNYRKELLIDRYVDLISHPKNLILLFKDKFSIMWSDFTYSITFANETIPNKEIKHIYNQYLFKLLTLLNYFVLFVVSAFGLQSIIINRRKKTNTFFIFLELFLLGSTALLMLTELSNKYTISLQLVFFIVSLCAIPRTRTKRINFNKEL